MSKPVISVVMPAYNAERYIEQAIESILRQTYDEFEVIVINDGSTDSTSVILSKLAAMDSRIRFVDQLNKGVTNTLNQGVALAEGEFIARMDADDISLPTRFEQQIDFLNRQQTIAVVGCAIGIIDNEGRLRRTQGFACSATEIRTALMRSCEVAHPAVMFRRAAVSACGGYRVNFPCSQDYDLWLRVSERHGIANLPEILLHYRWHDSQVSAQRFETQLICALAAQLAAALRRSGKGDPFEHVDCISRDSVISAGMREQVIDRRLIDACASRSRFLHECGFHEDGRKFGSLALEYGVRAGLARYAAGRMRLERAYGELLAGRYWRGAVQGLWACGCEPCLFADVWGAIRGRLSSRVLSA